MDSIKVLPIIAILVIAVATVSAQTKHRLKNSIAEVESSLIPTVRFEGEPPWDIRSRMEFYHVPGLSIAVIKDQKVLWSKAYGFADLESKTPVTSSTLFQLASMSKPVSAYAALKEVELGKLNPNADVNVYLKSWRISDNDLTKAKNVTLKNILSHTAGFTVSGFPGYKVIDPIPTAVEILSGVKPANTPMVYVDKLPGSNFRYSGGGYTVLQQMLVDIEGKDYGSIMEEKVLSPLGMKNSTFAQPLPESKRQFAATAYTMDGKKVELDAEKVKMVGLQRSTLLNCLSGNWEQAAADNNAELTVKEEKGVKTISIVAKGKVPKGGYKSVELTYRASDNVLIKMVLEEAIGIINTYQIL